MVLVDQNYLNEHKPIIIKWAESPFNEDPNSKYAFNPGWRQPTEVERFYRRVEEQSSIIKDSTRVNMESLEKDFQYLRTNFEFEDLRYLQGDLDENGNSLKGKQIQDAYMFKDLQPHFHRRSLKAVNVVARSLIPETFLRENLEKEGFLNYLESDYGRQAALECERIGMYGIADPTRPHGRGAIDSINGIFSQLNTINQTAVTGTDMPQGFGSPINTLEGNVIEQIMDKIEEYVDQNGRDENARFYISRKLYFQILKEAGRRETAEGDSVFFNGREVTIFGVPLKRVDFLNPMRNPEKRNGWGHLALMCDPSSLVWGFFNEVESKTTYEHSKFSYLASIQCAFDTSVIWEQDVLAFNVNDAGAGDLTVNVFDSSKKGVSGATVEIFDPDARTATTPLATGTTDADGVAALSSVAYGKYVLKVTHADYKDKEVEIVINNSTETANIKLAKA